MSSSSAAFGASSPGVMVEIAVQDPATQQERIFRSPLTPLRMHMRYFEPLIAKQTNEMKTATVTSPFTLRAKCDHRIFEWLLNWVNGAHPTLTNFNIVSVSLSSNFLQMRDLVEECLFHIRAHLPELVSSSLDLMALPMDLVLRLSALVRDSDLAATLQHLYDRKNASHPNRAFVATLLQHYVCHRLGVDGDEEEEDGARAHHHGKEKAPAQGPSSDSKPRAAAGAGEKAAVKASGKLTLKASTGLRWCRLCCSLFDQAEMQRLVRAFQLSSPECPAQSLSGGAGAANADGANPSTSSAGQNKSDHNGGSSAGGAAPAVVRCVGPRGEVFTTHAESRRAMPVVLDAPPLLKVDGGATTASATASAVRLERWAWRIIGATRYVSCRRCFHLVALTDVPHHHCSNLPQKFASPDNVAEDINHLVRWFLYCHERRVYGEEGEEDVAGWGLTPVLFGGPRDVLAEEVVEVQLCPKPKSGPSPPSTRNGAAGSSSSADLAAAGNDVADGRTVSGSVRPTQIAGAASIPPLSFWATKPHYVAEVMDKDIVDVDIQNYVERQHRFEVEEQQRRACALFNPPQMRLSISPVVGQASSSSSPSPRAVPSLSGASSTGSLSRGKTGARPSRVRGTARSPYGI